MDIILLRNKQCHIWETQLGILNEALKDVSIDVLPKVIIINDDAEAAQYKFLGSPTILINGKDIIDTKEPVKYTVYGCRLYVYQNHVYEYAPKEMLVEIISKKI